MKKDNTVNICIASDNNYAPMVATTIASVCANTARNVKFWCLETNISGFNRRMIDSLHDRFDNFEIEYVRIDNKFVDNLAAKMVTHAHISADTYSRLFIPDLFNHMDKMIYMDVDIIVTGDIGELYDVDLGRYSIGAIGEFSNDAHRDFYNNLQMSPRHHYFNAGVLLLNPGRLHKEHFMAKMLEITSKYAEYIELGDQDMLNKYADNNYLELPCRFNMLTLLVRKTWDNRYPDASKVVAAEIPHTVIRHFEADEKPWLTIEKKKRTLPNVCDFWTVAAMTPYLAWFQCQFQRIQTHDIITAMRPKEISEINLFGLIPFVRIRHNDPRFNAPKVTYMLFGFIPVLSCKFKERAGKNVWRLFDVLTVLVTRVRK